jgi:glutaryl-CoA dehydrogenase (non-decarboxylating)
MDFSLNDTQKLTRQAAREFVDREIRPYIREWDSSGKGYPREMLGKMAAMGFMGAPIPEEYGGQGLDYVSFAHICEELERGDTAFRVVMSVHVGLNSLTLLQWGTEEQKRKYLVPQAKGEKVAGFGLTEPNAGSDVASMRTSARKDGGDYVLNGSKIWISLADVGDHFLVVAQMDPAKKHRGLAAFIVERGIKGFGSRAIHGKLGVRAGNTGILTFDDLRVPAENRVGEEGEGFHVAMSALDMGRFTVATGAVGMAQACLDMSVDYANSRQTFGQVIGRHQLVQEMIANMAAGVESARLLCYKAAWLKNQGLRSTRETSLAKWYACDVATRAADAAIEIHGAYAYSDELPFERYWRNARGAEIYEGTREIHKLMQAEYALGYRQDRPPRRPYPKAQGY